MRRMPLYGYPYKKQLKIKQERVENLLKEYGRVKSIIGMEEPAHYRNKVHAVFAFQKERALYRESIRRRVTELWLWRAAFWKMERQGKS